MGNDLSKVNNELIIRRRKKIMYKRCIYFFIILCTVLITLALKHPIFNIKNIKVVGNKNISTSEIIKASNIHNGNNIFYVNINDSRTNILKNPYILEVDVKRKIPNKIEIKVQERQVGFYSKKGTKFIIIDKNAVVLEEKDNIDNMHLVRLDGFDFRNVKVGEVLPCKDKRKITAVKEISDIIQKNQSKFTLSLVDVTNLFDIKAYCGKICIKIGTANDLYKKFNKAINVLIKKDLTKNKGYIDVSFDNNPVFLIENK